jgi:mannose-binding lectin 2
MAMNGDGKTHYDHDFDGNGSELGGCAAEFRNKAGSTTVRITNIQNKYLKLEYKTPDGQNFITCFTISITLPEKKYLGFSAMTGGVSSEHAIQKIRVWNVLKVGKVNSRPKK